MKLKLGGLRHLLGTREGILNKLTGGRAQTPGQVNPLSIPSRRGHNVSRWMVAIFLLSMAHLACAGEQTPALHLEDFLGPQPGTVLMYADQNGGRLIVHAEPGASSGTLPLIRERVRPQEGTMPADHASLPRVIHEKALLSIQGQQLVEEMYGRRSVLLDASKAEWPMQAAVLRTGEGEGDTWDMIFGSCRREPPKSRYLFGAHREVIDVVCTIDDPMMGNMRFRHVFASGLGLLVEGDDFEGGGFHLISVDRSAPGVGSDLRQPNNEITD